MTKNAIYETTLIVWNRCGHYRTKQPYDVWTSVDAHCPTCGESGAWGQTRYSIPKGFKVRPRRGKRILWARRDEDGIEISCSPLKEIH